MRNAPPISTSSPRETITSLPPARRAAIVSSTAAALLLTTVAACAPVSVVSSSSTTPSRSPRPPEARSYSRLLGPAIIASRCCSAGSASSARPRLVWITVPVRLMHAAQARRQPLLHPIGQAAHRARRGADLGGRQRAGQRAHAQAVDQLAGLGCHQRVAMLAHQRMHGGVAAAGGRSKAGLSGLPSSHARWTRRAGPLAASGVGCVEPRRWAAVQSGLHVGSPVHPGPGEYRAIKASVCDADTTP